MGYVIYNIRTRKQLKNAMNDEKSYATPGAAKAALTRALYNTNPVIFREDHAVTTFADYHNNIVQMVERTNALTGAKYMEREDTPFYCSPSSETYWSS